MKIMHFFFVLWSALSCIPVHTGTLAHEHRCIHRFHDLLSLIVVAGSYRLICDRLTPKSNFVNMELCGLKHTCFLHY